MHVSNDDQPYSSATNAMEAWPETAEVFGALSHGPGRLRPAVTGRNRPEAAHRERQQSADSVEKVGHGFHGRKVRV
ncbi:nucleotidyltransferase family protein [Pseudomonas amygdali pv. tabaci str. ATCC 11528]|nr:nucleotidyltransferase family protein [Pseudomonas amygdali pv. tabaci str. ATCC 11528]